MKKITEGIIYGVIIMLITIASLLYFNVLVLGDNQSKITTINQQVTIHGGEFTKINTQNNLAFDIGFINILSKNWNQSNGEYSICIQSTRLEDCKNNSYCMFNYTLISQSDYTSGKEHYVEPSAYCDIKSNTFLHKHPTSGCSNKLTDGDLESAKQNYEHGILFYIIQCDSNKFEVYTRQNMLNGYVVTVE
jgi:hypothetical protein